jgi:hypothetical protein
VSAHSMCPHLRGSSDGQLVRAVASAAWLVISSQRTSCRIRAQTACVLGIGAGQRVVTRGPYNRSHRARHVLEVMLGISQPLT